MKRRNLLLALTLATAAAGSFAATLVVRTALSVPPAPAPVATDPLLSWLDIPAADRAEIDRHDPTFPADLRNLRADLLARRGALAATLERPAATDDEIRAASESVLHAANALERRVTTYLLGIRHHLTPAQQQRLFGLCAQGLRQGPGWRNRAPGTGGGMGIGPGQGMGGGRGQGPHGPGGRFAQPATRP